MADFKKITVEQMWDLFVQYKQWCEDNPIKIHDFVGKDGRSDYRLKQRPLTLDGFHIFVGNNTKLVNAEQYFKNIGGAYGEYIEVCEMIRRVIRDDQITGGLSGIYHHNLTARMNGLKDQVDDTGNKEVTIKVKYERKGSHANGTSPEAETDN